MPSSGSTTSLSASVTSSTVTVAATRFLPYPPGLRDALLELNVTSSMVLTRGLAPGMKERRWGRIIYTSSIMALASTAESASWFPWISDTTA